MSSISKLNVNEYINDLLKREAIRKPCFCMYMLCGHSKLVQLYFDA